MLVTTGSLLVALASILVALEQSGPHWYRALAYLAQRVKTKGR
jgi:hypothetical protein